MGHRCEWFLFGDGEHAGRPVNGGGTQPGITSQLTEPVERGLGFLDGGVVRQCAPPALRGGVVGLLHHALTVAPPRRADRDLHAVVLGDRSERHGHLPRLGMADRAHPVEAPLPREPAELAGGLVQGVDQMGLVLGRRQGAAPATGVRERTDQQVRVLAPPPVLRRVRQLEPVPLGLLTRRMLDRRVRPALRRRARLAVRPQTPGAELAGEGRIRPVVAEPGDLVEQGHRPQVRILGEACTDIVDERLERIGFGGLAFAGDPAAGQVGADGLAVPAQVPGDRRDAHSLAT